MKRAIILILDSLGIGSTPDAHQYGGEDFTDEGANTLGHIARFFTERGHSIEIPNLSRLGLVHAARLAAGAADERLVGLPACPDSELMASFACAREKSAGKDTPSGHWEIAGVPVPFDWSYFPNLPNDENCFPEDLLNHLHEHAQLLGSLGHCHASGTEIIARLGEEHVRTGKPIFYTSADSVFQIAAHEDSFGLERLYALCELARIWFDESDLRVGRVIARPFKGENSDSFKRTGNRRDYAVPPPEPTILDHLLSHAGQTIGIGKIGDIYAHRGLSDEQRAHGHPALWEETLRAMKETEGSSRPTLILTNFVDFDAVYGHRRDPLGYGKAIEEFDHMLPRLLSQLRSDDLLIITSDHGNDPTWHGTDHTREHIPILLKGPQPEFTVGTNLGVRESFADIAQTLAGFFSLPSLPHGKSMI